MSKSNSKESVSARKAWNESLPCKLRCGKLRRGFNSYCWKHQHARETMGDPRAVILRRSEYIREWEMAHALMKTHAGHESLVRGVAWINEYLEKARRIGKPPIIARAADQGVRGDLAIVEMLAVWLYRSTHSGPKTFDRFPLTRALTHAYIGLPRGPQAHSRKQTGRKPIPALYVPRKEREEIESTLLNRFAGVLQNSLTYWEQLEKLRNEKILHPDAPFFVNCARCASTIKHREARHRRNGVPAKRVYPPGGQNPKGINQYTKKTKEEPHGEAAQVTK